MKILLCTSEFGDDAGGLALHSTQLKEIFEKLGHDVYLEIFLNTDYYALDGGYDQDLGKKIRGAYKLKEMLKKYGDMIDLCVSCGAGRTAYYSMIFCKSKHIPLDIVLCGSEVNLAWEKADLLFFNAEAFKYASAVIGLSEELNQNARVIGGNEKCKYYIIPIICQMEELENISQVQSCERIVFASGSSFLGEKKGIGNLLLAFSKLINEKKRDDILYLYGKIDADIEGQYKKIIRENSLEKNVFLFGYLKREHYIEKIREVDVYIQASPFEGFGISVSEAVKIGKEILISDTGYIAERIGEKYPEHIIKSLKPADMAADIYHFVVNVYKKGEKKELREILAKDLAKNQVVSKWKQVLENNFKPEAESDGESCITVMFHDVDCIYSGVDYAKDGFEKLMEILYKKGYRLCSVKEYFQERDKHNRIICTFDDGYENVYWNALPCMKKYGFHATVYVCPDLIGEDNSWNHRDDVNRRHLTHDMILKLVEEGWEIGSHGLSHMNMIRLSEHKLDECLIKSKKMLQGYGEIESFCYPYGIFNMFIKEKVRKHYSNAFSVTVGGCNYMNDLYQITRLTPEELIKKLKLL